ncbi:MAG: dUTP diphosphatase [Treponema sp.]|jgi:dUTP pyrophosphatase|nr:dUTP diphosphatase [Treponema sp.]
MHIFFVKQSPEVPLPSYATNGSAGMDISAIIAEPVSIAPGAWVCIPTGLKVMIPLGFEGQIRPRSGLALRHGLTVLNAPGTIDSDYRGEIQVLLINMGTVPVTVHNGDRIAQLIIAPVCHVVPFEQNSLSSTERGSGGFGSTGLLSNIFNTLWGFFNTLKRMLNALGRIL